MSRISMLHIAVERAKAQDALLAVRAWGGSDLAGSVIAEYIACLDDALRECQESPLGRLRLEPRLDAAAQWLNRVAIEGPHHGLSWCAVVTPDRIGSAVITIARFADSPADALSLALADAAEWVTKQRDIK